MGNIIMEDKNDICNPSSRIVNGELYKKCCAWRFHAGNGAACFDMCSEDQRSARETRQEFNKSKKAMRAVFVEQILKDIQEGDY